MATTKNGTAGDNELTGTAGSDVLNGLAGDDTLMGLGGNDTLNGGAGYDTLIGGLGDDTYVLVDMDDTVTESANEGTDTLQISYDNLFLEDGEPSIDAIPIDLGNSLLENIEHVTIKGKGLFDITGNALNNKLTGNAYSNWLDGGAGADTLIGGAGNDHYIIDASDVVTELVNGGFDTVEANFSYSLVGSNLEGLILIGDSGLTGTGNASANLLVGTSGDDTLEGGAGNDTLDGADGADALIGGLGDDTYYLDVGDTVVELANGGNDTVISNLSEYTLLDDGPGGYIENLTLGDSGNDATGNSLANKIIGNDFSNIIDGGGGVDTLTGADGDDTYKVDLTSNGTLQDRIIEIEDQGTDIIELRGNSSNTSASTITLDPFVENIDASTTGASKLNFTGNDLENRITGNDADNIIDGGKGADLMAGGGGNDVYVVDDFNDYIIDENAESENAGIDTIRINIALDPESGIDTYYLRDNNQYIENATILGSSALNLTGNSLDNTLTGNAAANMLNGDLGNDTLIGGAGDDVYFIDSDQDIVIEQSGGGVDLIVSSISYSLVGPNPASNVENLSLDENSLDAINATGNDFANRITGNALNNRLIGGGGNDTLEGLGGNDTLEGGAGNDTYVVSESNVIIELPNSGNDTVLAEFSFSLADLHDIENLTLSGDDSTDATGNERANLIIGNAGSNYLTGGAGVDTLDGGSGDDSYFVNLTQAGAIEDKVIESSNPDFGEDSLVLTGTFNNSFEIALALAAGIENLDASGISNSKLKITGNAQDNELLGNASDNLIDGGLGADTMEGGLGDDTYFIDNIEDRVFENFSAGTDTVKIGLVNFGEMEPDYFYFLDSNVENLVVLNNLPYLLMGNELANTITGNSADNYLDGGGGVNTLIGGAGNDYYYIYNEQDVVIELASGGNDTVQSYVSHVLGANVENLLLQGIGDLNGTGNALANVITGFAGNDTLDGGAGNDTLDGYIGADSLQGGTGNDTYIVDDVGDIVTEVAAEGTDTVQSSISYTLTDNVENLILTGGGNGTGNSLNNTITGDDGDNSIDGGAGNDSISGQGGNDTLIGGDGIDTLKGGLDNDSYEVNIIQSGSVATGVVKLEDTVVENLDEGIDTLNLTRSIILNKYTTLVLANNIENLSADLTGMTLLNITGNKLDNSLVGNLAANIIDGGIGNDTLDGSAGNDTLKGGAGLDSFVGGEGDDLYILDQEGELSNITEDALPDIDTLQIAYNNTSKTNALLVDLSAHTNLINVENTNITGTGLFNLKGNNLHNKLTGNASKNLLDGGDGDDILNGGAGADTMVGGAGDDTYIVDNVLDVLTETSGGAAGTDTIQSSLSVDLMIKYANIENAILTGNAAINATGNAQDNVLTGNDGNNILDGGAGVDVMAGGKGNDTYIVDNPDDIVTEALGAGTDTVKASMSYSLVDTDGLGANGGNVENLILIDNATNGTGNALNNKITGNADANSLTGDDGNDTLDGGAGDDTLEGGSGTDSLIGGLGNDEYQVNLKFTGLGTLTAKAVVEDVVVESASVAAGNDSLKLVGVASLDKASTIALGTGLETLDARATAGTLLNLTGNSATNNLIGNSADNILNGAAGIDSFEGGDGNDTYVLDRDTELGNITELANNGTADLVQISYANTSKTVANIVDIHIGNLTAIENVSFTSTGTGLFNIVGNNLDNSLIGNASRNSIEGGIGNDSLNGGAGADTLAGGADNDSYIVDNPLDVIIELEDEGLDSVQSSVTYTLSSNIENLMLTGSTAINGTGNSLANSIQGNIGNNNLSGATGNDTLNGGAGNDILSGGAGDDSLIGGIGSDTAVFSGNVDFYDITFDNGVYTISGLDGTDTLEEIELIKFGSGAAVNIASLVQNEPSASKGIAALDSGESWSMATIKYSFINSSPTYEASGAHPGFRAMNAYEQSAVNSVLQQYENITNLNFELVTDANDDSVQLRFGTDDQTDIDTLGYAYYPDTFGFGSFLPSFLTSGDVWINNNSDYKTSFALGDLAPGSVMFSTILHEIGHALGLKHPGNYGDGEVPPFLSQAEDTTSLTVMSYYTTQHSDIYIENGSTLNYSYTVEPSTLMLYDIAAIQSIYGANADFNSGDTTYTFSHNQPILQTIWDGGGIDTIDASNNSNFNTRPNIIDLQEGHFSSIGMGDNLGIRAPNGSLVDLTFFLIRYSPNDLANSIGKYGYNGEDNLAIAYGTVIENAIGGLSNDILLGNASDNQLTGNGGNDTLSGFAGSDTLAGSEGLDTLWGGAGSDVFVFDSPISFQNNIDVISDFEVGIDKIYLDMDVYQQLAAGSLTEEAFNIGNFSMAQDTSDRIIYNQQTGGLYYDFDGNAGLGPVQFATLQGVTGLSSTDFIVA